MTHHGWISVAPSDFKKSLQSPFGRLFPATSHSYNSHGVSLLAGALGPLMQQEAPTPLHNTAKPKNPAGFTFFGQFVDHDMTEFRVVSPEFGLLLQNPTIGQRQIVLEDGGQPTSTNGRTGRLDLDSVYGLLGGPDLSLFDDVGRFRFRLNGSGRPVDIVRNVDYRDGRLIADPRNDENKIVVQLQVLLERLHNTLHNDAVTHDQPTVRAAVTATRERVADIYRRIVLYDYLPRVADPVVVVKVFAQIQANTSFYQKMNRRVRTAIGPFLDDLVDGLVPGDGVPPDADAKKAYILANLVAVPVEFSHAAFRLGHSQLLNGYRLNDTKGLKLFTTGPTADGETRDLRGNARIDADIEIGWKHFFGAAPQEGDALDASLPASVFRLPPPAIGEPPVSLAERNIRRGVDFGLPSGQEVAQILDSAYGDVVGLTPDQVIPPAVVAEYPELTAVDPSLTVITPLWLYILREADVKAKTKAHLGKVGSYIVAETLLGSLAATPGVDLPALMVDYTAKVAAAHADLPSPPVAVTEHEITSMAQLLRFLGEEGF